MASSKARKILRLKNRLNPNIISVIGKIFLCLLLFAILCIPPVFVNNLFGYAPVVTYVAVLLLNFIYLQILRHSVKFEELSSQNSCQRGQSIDFIVRLTNKFILPFPQIEIEFYISDLFDEKETLHTSVVTLAPREVHDFFFDMRFEHIGRYSAGLRRLTITDPLGLFSHTITGTYTCKVAVTPRIYPITSLDLATEENSDRIERVLSTSDNSTDYASVREYVMGDPLKTIHWNLSARYGSYLTRLYESYSCPRLDVVLDFCAPDALSHDEMMSVYDTLLETAFSLLNWAIGNGMTCNLVYQSKSGEARTLNSRLDSWSMLEACSDMPRIGTDKKLGASSEDLLLRVARSQMSFNIAYISGRIQDDVIRNMLSARKGKKQLLFFGLLPHKMNPTDRAEYIKPLQSLTSARVASYVLADAEELEARGQ